MLAERFGLQRHPISPRRHRESQKATLRQACTHHRQREERQEQGRALQFVEAEIGEAQVIRATLEEAPQSRAMLDFGKGVEGCAYGQGDEQVDGEADGRHARAEQPETLAEALAFHRLNAARSP